MASRYPNGMIEWIREKYKDYDTNELTMECNARFRTNLTPTAMKSLKNRYHFCGGKKVNIYSNIFPKEVCEFIENNYIGTGHQKMCDMIKNEFGRNYTVSQIKSFYKNHSLNSGLTGQFHKGHEPANKGQEMSPEMYEKIKGTMFKKGHRPHNTLKVGTEVITDDGYHKTKIAEPNVWELTQRLIWQENFGNIPEGMLVGFKDGNKDNLDPKNLMLLSNEEHLELTRRGMRSKNAEITTIGLSFVKISIAVKKKKKRG